MTVPLQRFEGGYLLCSVAAVFLGVGPQYHSFDAPLISSKCTVATPPCCDPKVRCSNLVQRNSTSSPSCVQMLVSCWACNFWKHGGWWLHLLVGLEDRVVSTNVTSDKR